MINYLIALMHLKTNIRYVHTVRVQLPSI